MLVIWEVQALHPPPLDRFVSDLYNRGMKTCTKCLETKPLDGFYRNKSRSDGYANQCKSCAKSWKDSNKDYTFEYTLRYSHNLSVEDYQAALDSQGGVCSICKTDSPGGTGRWAIDHSHDCCPSKRTCGQCFRGLLCKDCNVMVGYVERAKRMNFDFDSYLTNKSRL